MGNQETGEEDEDNVIQHRVKLFKLTKDEKGAPKWAELGYGPLRLNVSKDKESNAARLIMRRQGVWTLLLNMPLHGALSVEIVGDKMFRIVGGRTFVEDSQEGEMATFIVKCTREDETHELIKAIKSRIPQATKS